jgi:hypothetical protein
MGFGNFLNQTCTINRPTADITRNRYNQNKYSDVTVGAGVRCRLVEKSVKLMDSKTSEYTWVKATVLLLPSGTDIAPKDKVTIGADVWSVMEPLHRTRGNAEHHVSVIVEALNV